MDSAHYEVVVIGGGIHGAGVAQAAAAAGYKTLIIEQQNWAAGTSSRSSKLLHGGLRYLETAQISLVWQSLQERNRLLKLAPSLAHPLRFHIPIYQSTKRRPWQLMIGLSIYAVLSGLSSLSQFSWSQPAPPGLKKTGLKKIFSYWDGQTNDALLTQAVIHSAKKLGADLLCPYQLISAQAINNEKNNISGYSLTLQNNVDAGANATTDTDMPLHTHTTTKVTADYLVNCTGPWVNTTLALISPTPLELPCELIAGSHLILQEKLSDDAFYMESPQDGRAIFLLPWGEHSLLGTTEQTFHGDPKTICVSQQERDYLLQTASHYFPEQTFTVIDEFSGLRVLPIGNSRAFSRPRDCILHQAPEHPHLLSLYGGKLTTYRHTAEQVIKLINQQLGSRKKVADTRKVRL